MHGIFDSTTQMLERALDVNMQRQLVLSSNIANLDTPGFTPRDVRFDQAMSDALARARRGSQAERRDHTARPVAGAGCLRPDRAAGRDGNAVDLDVQMARLSQNSIAFEATTNAMTRRLRVLKYVVNDGGM